MSRNHQVPTETLDPGDGVLVLCSSFAACEPPVCIDLSSLGGTVPRHLAVTFTRAPRVRIERWDRHASDWPSSLAIVHATGDDVTSRQDGPGHHSVDGPAPTGDGSPSQDESTNSDRPPADVPGEVTVERVDAPGNPTRLGVAITERVDRLTDGAAEDGVTVCFDSVSALLQYVDLETAFRFLHALTTRFDEADAIAHYHLDPRAHDDQTVETLLELFDAVWELDEDGHVVSRS